MAITLTSIDPTIIDGSGGALLVVDGDFTGMTGQAMRVHVGPLGSSSDPACYSGSREQANIVYPVEEAQLRCYLPIIDPTGGPYDVFVQNLDVPDTGTLAAALTVLPQQYFSSVFDTRRPLPPILYAGPRGMETLQDIGTHTDVKLSFLEGVTAATGGEDALIGGFRITRLTATATLGVTSIAVENVLDWPESGIIGIDNVKYAYGSRTNTTLDAITHVRYGVSGTGTLQQHFQRARVIDLDRSWSALDSVRQSMLVDYAEEDDLNAIGRNLGVLRFPFLESDDVFREIIKAVAYNPKGTIYGLELALDALIGAGNYEIYEDLISNPNTVYIRLLGSAVIDTQSQGKAFLSTVEYNLATSDTTVDIDEEVVDRGAVASVQLRGESIVTPTRTAYPTAQTVEDYDGDTGTQVWVLNAGTEGVDVNLGTTSPDLSGYLEWATATAGRYYEHDSRILPESDVDFELDVKPVAGAGHKFRVVIPDGARDLAFEFQHVGASQVKVGFIDTGTGLYLGTPLTLADATWYGRCGAPQRKHGDRA